MNRRQLIATGIGAALLRFLPAWGKADVIEEEFAFGEWNDIEVWEFSPGTWQRMLTDCGFVEINP